MGFRAGVYYKKKHTDNGSMSVNIPDLIFKGGPELLMERVQLHLMLRFNVKHTGRIRFYWVYFYYLFSQSVLVN